MAATMRPLTLGEILDRTVQLYRRHFLLFVGISAPAAAALVLVTGSVFLFFSSRVAALAPRGGPAQADPTQLGLQILAAGAVFFLIGLPLTLLALSISLAALNYAAYHVNRGESATIRSSYAFAFRHFWRHVGILFLQALFSWVVPYFILGILVFIGAILAALATKSGAGNVLRPLLITLLVVLVTVTIVIAVLIWVRFSMAYPVTVAEEKQSWPSLKRSNQLTRGARGRIFVMFLLVWVVSLAVSAALAIPIDITIALTMRKSMVGGQASMQLLTFLQIANLGVSFLVRSFIMPIYALALLLFYYDQRTRHEGYDIELLMAQAGLPETSFQTISQAISPETPAHPDHPTPPHPEGTQA